MTRAPQQLITHTQAQRLAGHLPKPKDSSTAPVSDTESSQNTQNVPETNQMSPEKCEEEEKLEEKLKKLEIAK